MKKSLAVSLVLLGVVFLAGCGQQPANQTQPIIPAPVVQTPAQLAASQPTLVDEIATWQTYTNTKLGFEVKYPATWKMSESDSGINFMENDSQDISLSFFVYDKTINETEALLPIFSVPGRKINSRTNVVINNIDWIKLVVEENQIAQLTYKDGKTYAAQYSTSENISPKIISTFKFKEKAIEPLSYSTSGVSATVSKKTESFDYTAEGLKGAADECGAQHEIDYFDMLITKFNGANKTVYNFKYQGNSQDAGIYSVTLLPNKAGYTSLEQFKKDFDICAAGGDAYPTMLNSNWLLFVSACGSGFDDGSGRTHGCDEIKKIIEPSLKLN